MKRRLAESVGATAYQPTSHGSGWAISDVRRGSRETSMKSPMWSLRWRPESGFRWQVHSPGRLSYLSSLPFSTA